MSSELITISVNGQTRQVTCGLSVAGLVAELKFPLKFVAVERNREVVPRARHGETLLEEGDQLEVVTLVGGG
jgi:sulfur carrier protein